MTHTELEAAHISLCKRTEADLARIVGLCLANRAEAAGNAAARLLENIENTRIQFAMRQERAGADRYDLAALRVDTASASNSETGWEREE